MHRSSSGSLFQSAVSLVALFAPANTRSEFRGVLQTIQEIEMSNRIRSQAFVAPERVQTAIGYSPDRGGKGCALPPSAKTTQNGTDEVSALSY